MKAVVFHEFGGLDVLRVEDVDDPQAGAGQVVLDGPASALNHLDVDMRRACPASPSSSRTSSGSRSSAVAEVGEGVDGWQQGDRVMVF